MSNLKQYRSILFVALALTAFACQDPKPTPASSNNTSEAQQSQKLDPTVDQQKVDDGKREIRVLFFGDSITAGYGLSAEKEAFPYVFERIANDSGLPVVATGAGNSGETTAGGLRRIDWVLNSPYDVIVVELGGNDGLRGIPVESTRSNLVQIVETIRAKDADAAIVIAGMRLPPSLGRDYVSSFESIFEEVADTFGLTLIPFILDGVAGDPSLNQLDGIHPTAAGHEIIGERVWEQLEELLREDVSVK